MKPNKQQELEARKVYDLWWDSYLKGDADAFSSAVDEEMTLIGTTETELYFNKSDVMAFMRATIDQVAGKVEVRDRDIRVVAIDALVRIDEFSDMYVLIDGAWTFYAKLRLSAYLRQIGGQWKVVHQHCSFPDHRTEDGETIAPDAIRQENLQLREAVKRRTVELEHKNRELKMETCLERVRAVAMSMHKPADMLDVCRTISDQLQLLDVAHIRNVQTAILNDEKGTYLNYEYFTPYDTTSVLELVTKEHPKVEEFVREIRKARDAYFTTRFSGEELEEWIAYRKQTNQTADPLLERAISVHYYFYSIGPGALGLSTYAPLRDEDLDVFKRFRNVFDLAYRRFMDIEQAEAHAKEAQLELSLERVRARTLAMHRSAELVEASDVFFEQLGSLGIDALRTGVATFDEAKHTIEVWSRSQTHGDSGRRILGEVPTTVHPFFEGCFDAWMRKEPYFAYELEGNAVKAYYQSLAAYLSYPAQGSYHPREVFYTFFFAEGSLNVIRQMRLTDEELSILQRFAGVFGQMYRRFLDLQTAEAQAREAQIEAALERVRSRTMAMRRSDELAQTSFVLFEQLQKLGELGEQISIGIIDDAERALDLYSTIEGNQWAGAARVKLDGTPALYHMYRAWKDDQKSIVLDLSGEDLREYNRFRSRLRERYAATEVLAHDRWVIHVAFFSRGLLSFSTQAPRPRETVQLLERFAGVFDLTYTRFLDLKQAEAQAREATIEAALERVRSKAMAMRTSSDLSATSGLVFTELRKLGITSVRCGVVLLSKASRQGSLYFTASSADSDTLAHVGTITLTGHPSFEKQYDRWLKQEDYMVTLKNEELVAYYEWLHKQNPVPFIPGDQSDQEEHGYYLYFSEGQFYAWTKEAYSDEALSVLNRFKAILELTFRRYLEIQNAETQAREAQIEASLERVRSRTLAMQKSDELAETAAVLFRQLIALGIAPNRLYIGIIKDETGNAEFWITDEDGSKVSSGFAVNLNGNSTFRKMLEGWQSKDSSMTIDMQGAELQDYFRYLHSLDVPFKGGRSQTRRVQTLAYFSKGFIGMASPDEQPEETTQLLERFAAVFNLTFTRFNDLQLAEAQARQAHLDLIQLQNEKKRAEDALAELRETQVQLLQQEKLASLGQLTAGIAHEIKNPLNFVNNFSSVSLELLDEALQEMATTSPEVKQGEARQLLADVRTNLTKIIQHGTRADGIVKSMLQHSRGGSGRKEPIDLNALVREFTNLAFHGMRAAKHPINVDMVLDLQDPMERVSVIAEDFSRVIINLCQNAFDAMRDKFHAVAPTGTSGSYLPKLTVRTRGDQSRVTVEVSDNGPGIPEAIRDKILQPFFTTKKGTQGTGLGLSITHDIVKAHGGVMSIQSNPDGGATFVVELPADTRK